MRLRIILPVEIQFTQSKLYQADKQSLSTFKSLHKQEVDLFLLFQSLASLKNFNLSANILSDIPAGMCQSLPFLETVDLSGNSLTDIPAGLFQNLPSLKTVDLSLNLLTVINRSTFVNHPALVKINLAANQLNYIADDAISSSLDSLKYIDISKNRLTTIPASILCLNNLQDADLSGNYITFYSINESLKNIPRSKILSTLREEAEVKAMSFKRLSFLSNNISTIYIDSFDSMPLVLLFFHRFIILLDNLVCDCKLYLFHKIMHVKEGLTSPWDVHDFNKKILKCDKPDHLHNKLLYHLDPFDFVCAENIPHCPKNCTCYRRSMDKSVIVSCKQVQMSALSTQLPQGSIELDLSGNLITKFDLLYPYLAKLEKLSLQNNLINSISTDVLDLLDRGHIRELQLDTNRLHDLPQRTVAFMGRNLSHMTLGNNPWECTCHTAWMKDWLFARRDIIRDLDKVMCVTGTPVGQVYTEFIEYQFNCTIPATIVVRNALLAVVAVLVLCVIAVILIYLYRGEIKIIEYRVCLHDRDFMPGAYIEDNIMEAVKSSRRMILVLSQNYLKSDWCMLEFRAAHNKVLNDRTNYLILVLYDDVNVSELDEDMQLYIRTNTYLARSNQWFYDKLLYSMPTKNLQQLRKEMETKLGKTPSNDSLDPTYSDEQESSSFHFSTDTDTLVTTII